MCTGDQYIVGDRSWSSSGHRLAKQTNATKDGPYCNTEKD